MRETTIIAGRNVPISPGAVVTVNFTGGPNPGDAGPKDFWVIFNERDSYVARWAHGENPGERFRMMETEKGYGEAWEVARTATGIRPAEKEEVEKWLNGHKGDALFAESCKLEGETLRVMTKKGRYLFEPI